MKLLLIVTVSLALCAGVSPVWAAKAAAEDAVLLLSASNISRGAGNFLLYHTISRNPVAIRAGDTLQYDIFIPSQSTLINGALDIEWADGSLPFRDSHTKDQEGLDAHPDTLLPPARDAWYHRVFPLDRLAGKQAVEWSLVFEGDAFGPYTMAVGNIGVRHADGAWDWVYRGGELPLEAAVKGNAGYSQKIVLRPVSRAEVAPGAAMDRLIARAGAAQEREQAVVGFQRELQLAEGLAAENPDGNAFEKDLVAARRAVDDIRDNAALTPEDIDARLESGRKALARVSPLMKRFTGHLVGHGHIDFAWQWEWPETVDFTRHTFAQAIRFMDEFPGFTYSQSSSALYRAIQEHDPALFAKMRKKAKSGQWDVVGGRVAEADTWMLSPESHIRQFLLGQRYFRKWFGRAATVGWEPDTFCHTWSMPGILKMGGISSYYFGRGGHGKPLFWWQGPDGSRVLAFDEIASGSWYDSGLNEKVMDEILPWTKTTGTQDILWVYGVGNHGGGPTREQLQTAEAWMKTPYAPRVEFSTAERFFSAVAKEAGAKVLTVNSELDTRIDGCYTTHSDMKRLNRDAENWTASAETAATVASILGQPYPKGHLDELWYGICENQHHDTLPGSATHDVYPEAREELQSVIAQSRRLAGDSVRALANRVTYPKGATYAVLAFNPLGWTRDGVVRFSWPYQPDDAEWMAVSPNGDAAPVSLSWATSAENPTGEPMAAFMARAVPGFGYSVYAVRRRGPEDAAAPAVTMTEETDSFVLDNGILRATVRKDNGLVTGLYDHRSKRETVAEGGAANRLEVWRESGGRGDAWVIGEYEGHDALDGPAPVRVIQSDAGCIALEVTRTYRQSSITQRIVLRAGSDLLELPLNVQWREDGRKSDRVTPFLKMACDVAGAGLVASHEIPFATHERPLDGQEFAALKSADLSGPQGGITMLNDCKHGYSALGNTLRISLIRTPNRLDPTSDWRAHDIGVALAPHAGPYGAASVRRGFAFNQGLLATRVPPAATGDLPLTKSFVTAAGDGVVATVLKRAEDDPRSTVVHLYDASGQGGAATVEMPGAGGRRWVNFLEDPLPNDAAGAEAPVTLRPFEIRNAMFLPR
ncbi:MAG TPA: glycoside hydrolase family 38 C-terminal domain-containing protein [Armatimonadota bacterium]|jgi:alpha-mannosidase